MTVFEQITASPDTLAAALAFALPLEGPWDEMFRREFCEDCHAENCDEGKCPYPTIRGNLIKWWLCQTVKTVKDEEAERFQQQAKDLRMEASFQESRFSRYELATELKQAADTIETLVKRAWGEAAENA